MQKSVKQIRLQTMVRLLCGSTHDFTEGFYMSRKELYSSCSILDIPDNEKCIVHFLISHSGGNVINHPHVGHQSTSSGAWKLLDGCQLVPWPCTGRSPCQAARDGAHKVCQGSSSIL